MAEDDFIQRIRKINEHISTIFDVLNSTLANITTTTSYLPLLSPTNYEIHDLGDFIKILVDLPGVDKEDIKVRQLDDRTILIYANGGTRQYRAKIMLPVGIKNVMATYKNGLLTITGEKIKIENEGKEIPIV